MRELRPEQFGAIGDGVANDYIALREMARAVGKGDVVQFGESKDYFVCAQKDIGKRRVRVTPYGASGNHDIIYKADNFKINLNGASIKSGAINRVDDNDDAPYSSIGIVCPFFFDRCKGVVFGEGGNVIGPAQSSTHADTIGAGPNHGIVVFGGQDLEINDIKSTQWLSDGLWMGGYQNQYGPATGERETARNVTTNRCAFDNNARLGVAAVGVDNYVDNNSSMSYNGQTQYGWHSPACGIDVEPLPFNTRLTSATLQGTSLIDNTGCVLAINDQNAVIGNVILDNIRAEKTIDSAAHRATSNYLVANSDFTLKNSQLINVGVRSTDGLGVILGNTVTMNDGRNILFAYKDGSLLVYGNEIIYRSINPSKAKAIDIRNNSAFTNNKVIADMSAHDQVGSDLLADIASGSGNTWETSLEISKSWQVINRQEDVFLGSFE